MPSHVSEVTVCVCGVECVCVSVLVCMCVHVTTYVTQCGGGGRGLLSFFSVVFTLWDALELNEKGKGPYKLSLI